MYFRFKNTQNTSRYRGLRFEYKFQCVNIWKYGVSVHFWFWSKGLRALAPEHQYTLWKKSYIRSDKTRKRHQAYSSTDLHEISRLNLARVTPCVSKIKNVYTILQSAARFLFLVFLFETYKYRMYAIACMLQLLPSRRSGGCMHAAGWYVSG